MANNSADSRCLMLEKQKKCQSAGTDRISSLPDELLHHITSFLKAWEVVRTSVLSRRWRRVWASSPYLNAIGDWPSEDFVNSLLRWRHDVPLQTFLVRFNDNNSIWVEAWIEYALRQKVGVLEIWDLCGHFDHLLVLDHAPFVAHHLKSLTLNSIGFDDALLRQLNSSCPALEKLELINCISIYSEIFSCTIKHLNISNSDFAGKPRICVPTLVELHLYHPFFQDVSFSELPSLRVASISIGYENHDLPYLEDNTDGLGATVYNMFKSLSYAQTLEVLAPLKKGLLKGNLQNCPNFSNLKDLSLGEWCVDADFNPLVCVLRHTPVLEKLTLHLDMMEEKSETKVSGGGSEERKRLFTCKNLKLVEIKCYPNDKMVQKLVNFFQSNGIHRIIISQKS